MRKLYKKQEDLFNYKECSIEKKNTFSLFTFTMG